MRAIAEALFVVESTRARTAKVEALASALRDVSQRDQGSVPFAARFIAGTLLPTEDDRTLGTGGRLLFDAACEASGVSGDEIRARSGRSGDFGTAIGEAIAIARERTPLPDDVTFTLADAERVVLRLAETGARDEKHAALVSALASATPLEARYFVRAILGEMRIGAKEGIIEDAIAKAWDRPLATVRRAHGLVPDVGELALLAFEDRLADARIVVGRALGFMLATPIEAARGKDLAKAHAVEDKIDGIRAQLHVGPEGVRIFARGKGPVTTAFPDVTEPLAATKASLAPAILDGEIVVVGEGGRPRPFSAIQPRLKKLAPDDALMRELPVTYLAYDILYEGDESLLDRPFAERRERLAAWVAGAPSPIAVHDSRSLPTEGDVDAAIEAEFGAARGRGHEGLVLKRLDAPYAAGVRGFAWMKVKKAFATLDVVIVAAQRGYGKRAAVLSDYTFAVWDDGTLKTVGKAYSGLTDAEIATMTTQLQAIALAEEKHGYLPVRPEIVLEVAFDGLQRSDRHTSGFAMRFPRIANIRSDKKAAEADSVDTVRALYEAQVASGHREEAPARGATTAKKGGRKSGRRPDVRKKTALAAKQLKLFDD